MNTVVKLSSFFQQQSINKLDNSLGLHNGFLLIYSKSIYVGAKTDKHIHNVIFETNKYSINWLLFLVEKTGDFESC